MAQQAQKKTHWRSVHKRKNPELLYAEDLGPPGYTVDVEIVDTGILTVTNLDGKKVMPFLAFAKTSKRLGLNRTNCKTMTSLTATPVIEQWRGWVTLQVVVTEYNDRQTNRREKTDAIRIAPRRPRPHADDDARHAAQRERDKELGPADLRESDPEYDDGMSDDDRRAIELAEKAEAGK